MDKLACQKSENVASKIAAAGAEARYVPAYSPDRNPIEMLFSKLKESLRAAEARTFDGLIEAIGASLRSVTPGDISGWFDHAGYRYTQ